MKPLKAIRVYRRCFILAVTVSLLMVVTSLALNGQEPPPRPIAVTVNLSQNLSFGAFYQGNAGGTVIIFPNGSRSATGDIVLLAMGYSFSTGLYDVVANYGTIVSILDSPDAILTGNNGGTLTLRIKKEDSFPSIPIVINTVPPFATQVRVGGTLFVGNPLSNPAGNYSGTFNVTFVQE